MKKVLCISLVALSTFANASKVWVSNFSGEDLTGTVLSNNMSAVPDWQQYFPIPMHAGAGSTLAKLSNECQDSPYYNKVTIKVQRASDFNSFVTFETGILCDTNQPSIHITDKKKFPFKILEGINGDSAGITIIQK